MSTNKNNDKKHWVFVMHHADKDGHLTTTARCRTKKMTRKEFDKVLKKNVDQYKPTIVSVETKGYYLDNPR